MEARTDLMYLDCVCYSGQIAAIDAEIGKANLFDFLGVFSSLVSDAFCKGLE